MIRRLTNHLGRFLLRHDLTFGTHEVRDLRRIDGTYWERYGWRVGPFRFYFSGWERNRAEEKKRLHVWKGTAVGCSTTKPKESFYL